MDATAEHEVPWAGPPSGVRGGATHLSVHVGRSETTVVLLEGARAFAEGVVLRLTIMIRPTSVRARSAVHTYLDMAHGRGSLPERDAPGGLRWGVELSDGRSAWSTDPSPWAELPVGIAPADWQPTAPFLEGLARPSVYGEVWARDVWLWPLPPPGPVTLRCSWPDRGIVATTSMIDGGVLREASVRAERLWL